MTRHRDFKALARARMRRTGETYTAARAALLRTPPAPADDAARREQQRIVDRMFVADRLTTIPARRKVRAAVVLEVLTHFEPGQVYTEREVSERLVSVHEDFAYLRRELVSLGYLHRRDGHYWVCLEPPERTDAQRQELPAWEAVWLPSFVAQHGSRREQEVAS